MSRTKICPRCGDAYDDAVDFCAKDGTRLVRGGQVGDLIGTVIAERYRVVSRIGEGGMGQVYLAEHVRMKRKSAIKIMRPALVGDVDALQRFTREAENASQLSHPNIAAIFDFGESEDGVVYLAMEYVDGDSLAAKLNQDAAMHPDVAADILGQAADALQAAHDLNMLHRDIKPDNIMLGKRADGTYMVKLVDFGIARTMDGSDQKVTRTGFAVGTPQYMSPEQLAGDTLDARSDQYSLALVAFFAFTGKLAFPAESSKESLIARLTKRPQSLQDAKQDVQWPVALQEIFDRALAPEPSERFDTVSEFAHALSGAISSMTPTQTAELYRRALDVRVASVAARTPHSDLETLRTPSGQISTLRTPSGESTASGRTPSVTVPITPPRARWPFVIGGVVVVTAAATLMVARRERTSAIAPDTVRIAVQVPPTPAPMAAVPSAPAIVAAPDRAVGNAAGSPKAKGSASDSAKREMSAKAKKAAADSVARVNSARLRFPEAAARAVISRGIDAKARFARNDDIRVNIMPTPVAMWRADAASAWKEVNGKPSGGLYETVDPIEAWPAWKPLVSSQRAVYVVEVTPDKVPWPSYAPEKVFDIKKGDVQSVEFLRDGAPVAMDAGARIAAVANPAAHAAANKPVPNAFIATVSPATFIPREDGSWPKIELLVHDAARSGAVIHISLSESLIRRLYDDFAPWRDAIAKP